MAARYADGNDKPAGQATAVCAALPDDASSTFTKVGTPIG
jgi:hypothetical protein